MPQFTIILQKLTEKSETNRHRSIFLFEHLNCLPGLVGRGCLGALDVGDGLRLEGLGPPHARDGLPLEVRGLVVGDPDEGHAAVQLEDEDVEKVLGVLPLVVS